MLTIEFDPSYPQGAIETAASLVELLSDTFTTPRQTEFSDEALAGAQSVFGAASAAMWRAVETIGTAMRDGSGAVQPMRPGMMAKPVTPAAVPPAMPPVPEAAAALMDDLVAAMRQDVAEAGAPPRAESIAKLAAHRAISEAEAEAMIDNDLLRRIGKAGPAVGNAWAAKVAQKLIEASPARGAAPTLTEPKAPAAVKRRRAA